MIQQEQCGTISIHTQKSNTEAAHASGFCHGIRRDFDMPFLEFVILTGGEGDTFHPDEKIEDVLADSGRIHRYSHFPIRGGNTDVLTQMVDDCCLFHFQLLPGEAVPIESEPALNAVPINSSHHTAAHQKQRQRRSQNQGNQLLTFEPLHLPSRSRFQNELVIDIVQIFQDPLAFHNTMSSDSR